MTLDASIPNDIPHARPPTSRPATQPSEAAVEAATQAFTSNYSTLSGSHGAMRDTLTAAYAVDWPKIEALVEALENIMDCDNGDPCDMCKANARAALTGVRDGTK